MSRGEKKKLIIIKKMETPVTTNGLYCHRRYRVMMRGIK
jgi:hypothetical protein